MSYISIIFAIAGDFISFQCSVPRQRCTLQQAMNQCDTETLIFAVLGAQCLMPVTNQERFLLVGLGMSTSPQTWWFFYTSGKQLYRLISVPCSSKYSLVLNSRVVAQRSLPANTMQRILEQKWCLDRGHLRLPRGASAQSGASTRQGYQVPHFHRYEIHAHKTLQTKLQVANQIFL